MTSQEPVLTALSRGWPGIALVRPIVGGNRNQVWEASGHGKRWAVRLNRAGEASVRWELELLLDLARAEFRVPELLAAVDGSLLSEGICVFGWLDGTPPQSDSDWQVVASELRRLQDFTHDRPQRPGYASLSELVYLEQSWAVDLRRLPRHVVKECREAWRALDGLPQSVVHGDALPNVLMHDGTVGFIDWDESRRDYSVLDLADLPVSPYGTDERVLERARRAADAWEVANSWIVEPEYARRRLERLRARPR